MSEMKHTPLPWELVKRSDEDNATLIIHVGEEEDRLVCETNVSWRDDRGNAANAAFIVTACNSYYDNLSRISSLEAENKRLSEALANIGYALNTNHGCMATIISDISKIVSETTTKSEAK